MSVFRAAHTDLHLSTDEWNARLQEEGDDGFADPVLMKHLSEIQVPVVIRGDGLKTIVWELETLLALFRKHAPDAAGSIPHPYLQGRRFTLDDIEAVTGPEVDPWNAFTVGADIGQFRDNQYTFQTDAADFLLPVPPPRIPPPPPDIMMPPIPPAWPDWAPPPRGAPSLSRRERLARLSRNLLPSGRLGAPTGGF